MGFIDRPDYGQTPSLRFLENHSAVLFITNGSDHKYLWANGNAAAPAVPTSANVSDGFDDLVKISSSNSGQLSDRLSITHSVMADGVQFALNYSGGAWTDLTPFEVTIDCAYVSNFVNTGPIEAGNSPAVDTVYGTYLNVNVVPLITAEINSVTTTLVNDTDAEIIVTFKRQIRAASQPLTATLTGWQGVLNGTTFLYDSTGQYYTGVKFTGHWLENPGTPMPATHSLGIKVLEGQASYYDGTQVMYGSILHIDATKLITITGISRAAVISQNTWVNTFFSWPGNTPGSGVTPAKPYLLRSAYTPKVAGAGAYATVLSGGIGIRYIVAVGFVPKSMISYVDLVLRLTNPGNNPQTYVLGNLSWLRSGTYQFDGPSGPSYPCEFYGFDIGSNPTVSKNILSVLPAALIAPSALTSASPAIAATLISRLHTASSGATPIAVTNPSSQFYILPLGGDTHLSMKAAFASPLRTSSTSAFVYDASFTVRIAPSAWVKRVRILFNINGTWVEFGTTDATALHYITHVAGTDNYVVRWWFGFSAWGQSYFGAHSCMLEIMDLNDVISYVGPMTMTVSTQPAATTCCFKEGTPIQTPSGEVPIENIKVGDEVITIDLETGKTQISTVTSTLAKLRSGVHKLKFEKKADLLVTDDHALYTPETPEKWSAINPTISQEVYGPAVDVQIQSLLAGDNLFESTGTLREIKDITPLEGEHAVHTFGLDPKDKMPWYFAGGVLAHNGEHCCVRADTLIATPFGFRRIDSLIVDDIVTGYDVEANAKADVCIVSTKRVIRTSHFHVLLEDGRELFISDDHAIWCPERGWVAIDPVASQETYGDVYDFTVQEIQVGDTLFLLGGLFCKVASIVEIPGDIELYSFELPKPYSAYFANDILIHNCGGGGTGCSVPDTCCFLAGTPISTPNGYRPIEKVEAGDTVFTYDFKTNLQKPAVVESTLVKIREGLYRLDYGQEKPLFVTADHAMFNGEDWLAIDPDASQRVYGERYGFTVKPLIVGSRLFESTDVAHVVEAITPLQGEFEVYTFKLEGKENPWYFAGNILAHNKCCFRGDTRVATSTGERFIQDLKVGDWVTSFDENRNLPVEGQIVAKEVVNRSHHYKLVLENCADTYITGDHPMRSASGKWVAIEPTQAQQNYGLSYGLLIQPLVVGDSLVGIGGVHKILATEKVMAPTTMYTFDVRDPLNIYFANGLMAHNTNCHTCCFRGDTQISTATGTIAIQDLRVGDEVMAYDHVNDKFSVEKVLTVKIRHRTYHFKMVLDDGSEIFVSNDHPMMTADKRWVAIDPEASNRVYGHEALHVKQLVEGDELFGREWNRIVKSFIQIDEPLQMYTFSLPAPFNAYFANGILAHNSDGGGGISSGGC